MLSNPSTMSYQLLLATANSGKLAELQVMLQSDAVALFTIDQISATANLDVPETGTTFAENALIKARAYGDASGMCVIADDSGLEVTALNSAPGVLSARYAPGTDSDRCQALLTALEGSTDRSAQFVSVLCYYHPQTDQVEYFTGVCSGMIATQQRGNSGFGYDPIFIPAGYTQTMAELGLDVKNVISHRAQALKQLVKFLESTYKLDRKQS